MPEDDETKRLKKEVKDFEKLAKRAERIANATELAHSDAYKIAADKYLMNEDGDELDLEKLEDEDMQEKFADEMSNHYLTKAKKYFKSDMDEKDPLKADGLMREYAGTTKTELLRALATHGKDYNLKVHEDYRGDFMKQIRNNLNTAASGKLTDKHTKHIVKHLGIDDIVDAEKMKVTDAINLHGMHKENGGSLTKEYIKKIYKSHKAPSPVYLK